MKSIQEYWDQTLQCMQHELNVSEIKINAFFRSIKPVDVKGDTLILSVDIGFIRESLSTGTKIVVFCENKILSSIMF